MNDKFIKLYDDYKNDIYRLAISYTKNKHDSEDIVQNVFIKYYKNIDKVEEEYIKQWLIKVTINECKNVLLSSWKKRILPFTEKEENMVIDNIEDDSLLTEIFKLPKKNRIIIHLHYYEGYDVKEIARLLKMTESNVKVSLYRSRKLLKDILMEEDYER